MKLNKQYIIYPVLIFALCLAIQKNWSAASQLVSTVLTASKPFLMGAALAYIINIVMGAYETLYTKLVKIPQLLKIKRPLSMILAYATFGAVLVLIFNIVLPDLIASLKSLLSINPNDIKKVISQLQHNKLISKWLAQIGSEAEISNLISKYSQQILSQVLSVFNNLLLSVTSIASAVVSVFVSLIFSIYVLVSKEKLGAQFKTLVDTYLSPFAHNIHYVQAILHERFHGFFVGQTIEAIILGSLSAIGMTLLGLPYAATIGVLIAFTALIPVVGAYIGVTIGAILILTQSLSQALIFVIFLVVLQQFEGNLIYPRVVGGSIGLPSMWVLLVITIGASLGGVLGMLIAVPLSASLYQMLKDHVRKKQSQKQGS
ncbi:AI-2E family transporter [Streptococcus ferus]|uniref:Permease n=2 Tax=Streptococcus ferus TaxID=1345 RepID=A0A2X3VLX6_9STRE|nr:AI-2E family transporter [Streptococcus ferus]SQF40418.1 permease [Streptococcus ferus]